MKRIIYILLFAAIFSACRKELPLEPAISFFGASPEILSETAIFRLAYANITDSTERVFPVRFGGTAELGSDYTVSGDRFIFGGDNPVDSIVVTTLKLGTEKTLSLTVEVPEGYVSGKYTTSEYTLQDKLAYLSFTNSYMLMYDSLKVGFTAKDKYGRVLPLASDIEISLSVNEEKSTATEGIDFSFTDSTHFTINEGKTEGSLGLKLLNPHPQDGKDKVILNFRIGEKCGIGETAEIEINLLDTLWKHLDGSWAADSLVTDSLYMDKYWNGECSGLEHLPKFDERDNITISMSNMFFTPSLRSGFKNYFSGLSDFRKGPSLTLDLGNGANAELWTLWLDNTNRDFSSGSKSEDKESLVGIRLFPDNTDSLDLYVIDYVSKSFMPELETNGRYAPEKPVAASPGVFLNMTLIRK